jgi:hypothetical protein
MWEEMVKDIDENGDGKVIGGLFKRNECLMCFI